MEENWGRHLWTSPRMPPNRMISGFSSLGRFHPMSLGQHLQLSVFVGIIDNYGNVNGT